MFCNEERTRAGRYSTSSNDPNCDIRAMDDAGTFEVCWR
jgi:hypothetical protein